MGDARRSRIGFAIVLLIVLVVGIGAYLNGRQFIEANRQVIHTVEVQRTVAELLTLIVDAETGGRGFFITGNPEYLDPYNRALANIDPAIMKLHSLLTDNPEQQARLTELQGKIDERLQTIVSGIERRRTMTLEEATQTIVSGRATTQMEEIRTLVETMQNSESALLAERTDTVEQNSQITILTFGGLTVLAGIMLVAVYAQNQRSLSQSRHNEQVLESRVSERTSQLQFLADASTVLTEPLAYQQKLQQVAQMSVPRIADWCVFQISTDDGEANVTLEAAAVAHRDPAKLPALRERLILTPPERSQRGGAYEVFETGQAVYYSDIDALLNVRSGTEQHPYLELIRQMGLKSAILVPINANGKRLGVLTMIMDVSNRHFTDADRTLAEEIANRAGLLIENGRLFKRIRQMNADLENRVKERTQQLEAINAELEAFNYSVSHDLRAPLRSIDGFSAAMLEDYGGEMNATAQSYLKRVRAAAQRMGELIDDLLGLSRLTRVEMNRKQIDLSAVSQSIVDELRRVEPEREIRVVIEPGLSAEADPHLVKIMLDNLIGNAWKFTRHAQDAHIAIGKTEYEGQSAFFVSDNGAGFDMTYVDKLFGAFERLHNSTDFEGSGIGLATVQRIINRHGGKVRAVGKVGEGATFYFTLSSSV